MQPFLSPFTGKLFAEVERSKATKNRYVRYRNAVRNQRLGLGELTLTRGVSDSLLCCFTFQFEERKLAQEDAAFWERQLQSGSVKSGKRKLTQEDAAFWERQLQSGSVKSGRRKLTQEDAAFWERQLQSGSVKSRDGKASKRK